MKLPLLVLIISVIKHLDAQCDEGVFVTGMTENEKAEALNAHNNFRLKIARGEVEGQPRGTNLKRMVCVCKNPQTVWDDKLAYEAQLIANTCVFAHKSVTDDRWSWVGQNLYARWSTGNITGADWNAAVSAWFSQHERFIYGPIDANKPEALHYTQVVWANSNHLGCGYIYFASSGYKQIYVCNYGPGGNYVGQVPYETEGGCLC